jgi:hypothetical protein
MAKEKVREQYDGYRAVSRALCSESAGNVHTRSDVKAGQE